MSYIDVVYEDCGTEEGSDRLREAVHKCRPFRNMDPDEDVPFEKLERLVGLYCQKYGLRVQWIRADYSVVPEKGSIPKRLGSYHAEIAAERPYRPILEVGASSMHELFSKLCVALRWAIVTGKGGASDG